MAILELLTPFWGVIVAILKNSKVVQLIQDKNESIILIIKESITKNVEWLSGKLELE